MSALGQYILTVSVAAVMTSLIRCILTEGLTGEVMKLISGLILAITMLSPLKRIDLSPDMLTGFMNSETADLYCDAGAAMAETAISDIIQQETEAYILSKANEWNAQIQVDVSVQERIPNAVQIHGNVSPEMQRRITLFMEQDLGIPREKQVWI